MERRRYLRVRKGVKLKCHIVAAPEEYFDISTRNLSMDGLLVTTRQPLAPGTMIQLHASVQSQGVELALSGRVVWAKLNAASGHQEAGVRLLGLDAAQRRNVLRLIGKQADPNAVERRHYIRLKRRLLVRYRAARGFFSRWRDGQTEDLSAAGLALRLVHAVPPSSALVLKLYLDDTLKPLRLDGQVVACAPAKEGDFRALANVRFRNLGEEARRRLAAYVSSRLAVQAPDIEFKEGEDDDAPE